ncbi:hypothetical protein EC9_51950 [Rosistilla ulvae]|uniref:J domain-containing protein n=1 Tax=Rosistilla ulvae TaxID=1930277 RepID=A0A517M7V9_9BACT|nr:J domain-containing protein [Rosistilla ulvae]QDS90976.1 hypothetical protein EC9_51950 [Rosistilla ulvae]
MSEMHQLLGLDPRIERPNAYQIFGLEVLESDDATIRAAIRTRIASLKAAKESADPTAWAQAAKSVNKAQQILGDPQQKGKYDSRLQSTFDSVAVGESRPVMAAAGAATTAPTDPLAGWLPESDPFSIFDMAAALEQLSSEPERLDQEIEESLAAADDDLATAATAAATGNPFGQTAPNPMGDPGSMGTAVVSDAIVNTPKTRVRRKRGFPVAGVLMTLFVLSLFGAMGYCVKLLMDREKNHAAQIAQTRPAAPAAAPAAAPQRPRDNVMGDLLPEGSPTQSTEEDSGIRMGVLLTDDGAADNGEGLGGRSFNQNDMSPSMGMNQPMGMSPSMEMTTVDEIPMAEDPKPTKPPEPEAPSPAMIQAATAAAKQARDAIAAGDWDQMMPLAEKANDLAQTPEQQQSASARRRLVHYAGEYQAAIDRSLDQPLDTLEIREGLTVAVVEVTPTELTLRLPGRNKTYPRATLPAVVANALAPLSLPKDDALVTTFRSAWQCLQKEATPADRELAFKDWQRVAGQSADADVSGLEAEVKAIFP